MNFLRLSLKQFILAGTLVVIPGAIAVGIYNQQLWAISILIVFFLFLTMFVISIGLAGFLWGLAYSKRVAWGIKIPVRTIPGLAARPQAGTPDLATVAAKLQEVGSSVENETVPEDGSGVSRSDSSEDTQKETP